jgi:Phage integrase family
MTGRPIQPATIAVALRELHGAGLAAVDVEDQDELAGRGSPLPVERDPLLNAVDLHGAHDFRHTYATWLEDAGIPARVIDELMGHEATGRTGQHRGSAMGAHYRHHPGDGRTGHRRHSATTHDRAPSGRRSPERVGAQSVLTGPRQRRVGFEPGARLLRRPRS